ncbi:MAG: HD-GYP domain-containing protein [Treponema sp.]|jgi:HD-GYP domain-containing protein (c-di-GMP phosphodiesterase class II)|nr:HD-GYP domain-containing protein [Treponema sp.]
MTEYAVKDIAPDSYFSEPLYLDERFVLLAPEMRFTGALRKLLKQWDFPVVLSGGEPRLEFTATPGGAGCGLLDRSFGALDQDRIKRAEALFQDFHQYTEALFTHIAIKGTVSFAAVSEKIQNIREEVKENHRFLLRVIRGSPTSNSMGFLATHAVISAIISIIIGNHLKLPGHRINELGVAALLHEAGMVKVPSQLYMAKRVLSPQDRKIILNHPVYSYNILKSCDFPIAVSVAALEHHERENGAGYPRKLTGDKITLYAKIIAVACSYEAMTSSRPHKDANDGYTGMMDLLKNVGKQYDDTVVRALVYSLSIYPIGLYVLLSDGTKGQVVDVNPENPKYPVVQVFGKLTPDGKNSILETSAAGVSIARPLLRKEIDIRSP